LNEIYLTTLKAVLLYKVAFIKDWFVVDTNNQHLAFSHKFWWTTFTVFILVGEKTRDAGSPEKQLASKQCTYGNEVL